jgi:hypothetical protein
MLIRKSNPAVNRPLVHDASRWVASGGLRSAMLECGGRAARDARVDCMEICSSHRVCMERSLLSMTALLAARAVIG